MTTTTTPTTCPAPNYTATTILSFHHHLPFTQTECEECARGVPTVRACNAVAPLLQSLYREHRRRRRRQRRSKRHAAARKTNIHMLFIRAGYCRRATSCSSAPCSWAQSACTRVCAKRYPNTAWPETVPSTYTARTAILCAHRVTYTYKTQAHQHSPPSTS